MTWIILYLIVLFLVLKYSNSKLTKAVFIIFFLVPATSYYDKKTYKNRIESGYGCIVRADRNINSSYYLIIEENGNEKKYSLDGIEEPFDSNVIGKCVYFNYYKDVFGFKVILKINQ